MLMIPVIFVVWENAIPQMASTPSKNRLARCEILISIFMKAAKDSTLLSTCNTWNYEYSILQVNEKKCAKNRFYSHHITKMLTVNCVARFHCTPQGVFKESVRNQFWRVRSSAARLGMDLDGILTVNLSEWEISFWPWRLSCKQNCAAWKSSSG